MAHPPASTPPDVEGKPRRRYAPRMPPEQRREHLLDATLTVILQHGYSGVSIEAVARAAGVTRPVVYDHFPNLSRLLRSLIEREERCALEQLEDVVPEGAAEFSPDALLIAAVRRFLDAVASRPATWRIILMPPEGTPAIVRELVDINRSEALERIERLVRWASQRSGLPDALDIELTARALRDLGEEAARMVLTDPSSYPPERYERYVETVMGLLWPRDETGH
jgi:AcrR family transcriptional regulator